MRGEPGHDLLDRLRVQEANMSLASRRHGCRLRLSRPGMASGQVCTFAKFHAWEDAQVRRLPVRKIVTSKDAANAVAAAAGPDLTKREHLIVLGLDAGLRIVAVADGSSAQESMCDFSMLDAVGSLYSRHGRKIAMVVLGHNHPGGDPQPSPEDVQTTKNILCEFNGLSVIDHVIVTPHDHFSMRDVYGADMFWNRCEK